MKSNPKYLTNKEIENLTWFYDNNVNSIPIGKKDLTIIAESTINPNGIPKKVYHILIKPYKRYYIQYTWLELNSLISHFYCTYNNIQACINNLLAYHPDAKFRLVKIKDVKDMLCTL